VKLAFRFMSDAGILTTAVRHRHSRPSDAALARDYDPVAFFGPREGMEATLEVYARG
jgi:hypothetical protein